jgi:hypothetical protein
VFPPLHCDLVTCLAARARSHVPETSGLPGLDAFNPETAPLAPPLLAAPPAPLLLAAPLAPSLLSDHRGKPPLLVRLLRPAAVPKLGSATSPLGRPCFKLRTARAPPNTTSGARGRNRTGAALLR